MPRAFVSSRLQLPLVIAGVILLTGRINGNVSSALRSGPLSRVEVTTLIKLFEQAHYGRASVSPSDFSAVIEDYMAELDPERIFFLEADRSSLVEKHAQSAYADLAVRGSIDAGKDIFDVYCSRVHERVDWVGRQLEVEPDFSADESYSVAKVGGWPATLSVADELWRKRLKAELIVEILNNHGNAAAAQVVLQRYLGLRRHIDSLEASDQAEGFLSAACRLFDPHSGYITEQMFREFGRPRDVATIGATFERNGAGFLVKDVVAETSADGNLRPGDRLISIAEENGPAVETFGMTMRQLLSRLPGANGTKMEFVIAPGESTDSSRRRRVTLTRTTPTLNPVRARLTITTGTGVPVAVVTLPSLYGVLESGNGTAGTSSSQDVANLLKQAHEANVAGLLLDLRGNGGGYFSESTELAQLFVGRRLITYVRNYDGTIKKNFAQGNASYDGPMVVLVDKLTASGAEIVAGVLQCYGRAIIAGSESTWGNGTIQQVLELKQLSRTLAQSKNNMGAAKLTIQRFYLPNGDSTQLKGVKSDIVISSLSDRLWKGEAGLRRALPYDKIRVDQFDGTPSDQNLIQSLQNATRRRQESLPELAGLQRSLDWWRARHAGDVSLSLDNRRRERTSGDGFWPAGKLAADGGSEVLDVTLREAVRVLTELTSASREHKPTVKALP